MSKHAAPPLTGWRRAAGPVAALATGAAFTALLPWGWKQYPLAMLAGITVGVLVDALVRAHARAPGAGAAEVAAEGEGFTCPRCGRTSHHPTDKAEGYCGACRDWTDTDAPRYPFRGET